MASCKHIRRLALLHHARGLCHKQDVDQVLAALEEHVTGSGKELLASLKDFLYLEKQTEARELALAAVKKEKEVEARALAAVVREKDELQAKHVHAGKEKDELQAKHGKILFHRGPMSSEQVNTFLCIGKAACVDIAEDPSTRPF